jgi:hypothetical protein
LAVRGCVCGDRLCDLPVRAGTTDADRHRDVGRGGLRRVRLRRGRLGGAFCCCLRTFRLSVDRLCDVAVVARTVDPDRDGEVGRAGLRRRRCVRRRNDRARVGLGRVGRGRSRDRRLRRRCGCRRDRGGVVSLSRECVTERDRTRGEDCGSDTAGGARDRETSSVAARSDGKYPCVNRYMQTFKILLNFV